MAEIVKNVKIINRFGTLAEWNGDNSVILALGEIGLAQVSVVENGPTGGDFNPPQWLAKVGDGSTPFKNLKWLAAPASDVYGWAKKVSLDIADIPIFTAGDKAKIDAAVRAILADAGVASDDVVSGLAKRLNVIEGSSVEGKDAIVASTTDVLDGETVVGKKTEVSIKLDNSGNVKFAQGADGLKAEVTIPDAPVQNVSGDGKVITVTPTEGDYKVSATLGLKYVAATESTNAKIALTGIDGSILTDSQGNEIAIDASDFVKDGMLESVTYSDENNTITFTWNVDGEGKTTTVDLDDILEAYTAGDGIDITEHVISVKLDATTENFLTVGENGLKLDNVQKAIDKAASDAKEELIGDDEDTAESDTIKGAKKYADSLASNYATAAQGEKADTAVQDVTADADTGLVATKGADNKVTISCADDVVFILDGGTALSDGTSSLKN